MNRRREQHPKHHRCVRADFIVDAGLDVELRHGLFAQPGIDPALIRFSNGAPMDACLHQAIYDAISKRRYQLNRRPAIEPGFEDFQKLWNSS